MKNCVINYFRVKGKTKDDKLEWLNFNKGNKFKDIPFEHIIPDKKNNWIDISKQTEWDLFLPTIDKSNKLSKSLKNEKVIFKLYSFGIVSNRDEWVYDFEKDNLIKKINIFYLEYHKLLEMWIKECKTSNFEISSNDKYIKIATDFVFKANNIIKWSGRLFRDKLLKQRTFKMNVSCIQKCIYRPFSEKYLYFDYLPIDNSGQQKEIFPSYFDKNKIIFFNGPNTKEWNILSSNEIVDLNLFYGGAQCLPLFRYDSGGNRIDNITDWGLTQFQERYGSSEEGSGDAGRGSSEGDENGNAVDNQKDFLNSSSPSSPDPRTTLHSSPSSPVPRPITKEDIFHYIYAVLHNPEYRKKYELNLKREFPRIPFYDNFWKWANWGEKLMNLHINFEEAEPFPLEIWDEGRGMRGGGSEKIENDIKNNNSCLYNKFGDVNEKNSECGECKEDSNKELSGPECMEGSNEFSNKDLQNNKGISEGGTLRTNFSNTESIGINSIEHSGGTSAEKYEGIHPFPFDSKGFDSRIGNSTNDSGAIELHSSECDGKYDGTITKNREHAGCINEGIRTQNLTILNPESPAPRPKLKADKENGTIVLDTQTTIKGIPKIVWEYKLGNRSALEWILDQYKEKKPKDPTIAEKFNTYRFADYKEKVIDLIRRVTTVSVETIRIIKEMEEVLR